MSENIVQMIDQIEKDTDSSNAYVFLHIESEQHGYNDLIEGNPQGLRLLAAALLRHSLEVEKGHFEITNLSNNDWSANKSIPVSIVGLTGTRDEILKDRQQQMEATKKKTFFGDWGCLFILILVVVLVIFGIVTVIRLF